VARMDVCTSLVASVACFSMLLSAASRGVRAAPARGAHAPSPRRARGANAPAGPHDGVEFQMRIGKFRQRGQRPLPLLSEFAYLPSAFVAFAYPFLLVEPF
jgi:hypothetical protein